MLEVTNLCSGYGSVPILRDISFSAPGGSITLIVGENGAGKSTLLRTIAGFIAPTSGTITFGGASLHGLLPEKVVSSGVRLVLDGHRVFPAISVWDNIRLGASPRSDKASFQAAVDEVLTLFPILKERLRQQAGSLSGGQQQMLALAQAFVGAPRFLLCDEPSLGLAQALMPPILTALDTWAKRGMGIIVVEQYSDLVLPYANQAIVLEQGRVLQCGPPSAFKASIDEARREQPAPVVAMASQLSTERVGVQVVQHGDETLPKILLRAAAEHGAKTAIIGPGPTLTYRELYDRTRKVVATLVASGVKRGDRVAVWLPNCTEFIEVAFAIAFVGASMVPLSTRLKGPEVAFILRKSRPTILVGIGQFLGTTYGDLLVSEDFPPLKHLYRVGPGRADWEDWAEVVASTEPLSENETQRLGAEVQHDDVAEIMFTSGTTGFPKGTMLRHSQIVRAYTLWARQLGMSDRDRYLIIAPMFHSYGFKAGVVASVVVGASMYSLESFDAKDALEIMERERISITGGPPTIFISLLDENEKQKRDISCLRAASTGGSMVPPSMIRSLQRMGVETVLNAYGLTEATALVTMTGPGDSAATIASTSGRALDGVEVRCVTPEGKIANPGETGEVQVRGFDVMAGYFEDDEATRKTMTDDGWLKTGDVGVLDKRGYLQITDRIKDMFIVGGFNCFPAEIERVMLECPMVGQVAVIGIPDDRMGEVGKAFIVPRENVAFNTDDFLAWCRAHMANYKVPRQVAVVDALPRNAMGKIQKFVLRSPSP